MFLTRMVTGSRNDSSFNPPEGDPSMKEKGNGTLKSHSLSRYPPPSSTARDFKIKRSPFYFSCKQKPAFKRKGDGAYINKNHPIKLRRFLHYHLCSFSRFTHFHANLNTSRSVCAISLSSMTTPISLSLKDAIRILSS